MPVPAGSWMVAFVAKRPVGARGVGSEKPVPEGCLQVSGRRERRQTLALAGSAGQAPRGGPGGGRPRPAARSRERRQGRWALRWDGRGVRREVGAGWDTDEDPHEGENGCGDPRPGGPVVHRMIWS